MQSTILIVDDEPTNLALLTELLRPHYRVRAAQSGHHALRAVRVDPRPDLILLDVVMPELDGYGVLRELRSHPDTRGVPVI
ncbi:response regulator [Ectothiorhodospira sp. 9100]